MFVNEDEKRRRVRLGEFVTVGALFTVEKGATVEATPKAAGQVITVTREGARVRFADGSTGLAFVGELATEHDFNPLVALQAATNDAMELARAA